MALLAFESPPLLGLPHLVVRLRAPLMLFGGMIISMRHVLLGLLLVFYLVMAQFGGILAMGGCG